MPNSRQGSYVYWRCIASEYNKHEDLEVLVFESEDACHNTQLMTEHLYQGGYGGARSVVVASAIFSSMSVE